MGFAVFLGLASITGTLVLDKKGQLKVLAEGMALQEGDVVLSVIDGQSTNDLVGVDIIGENGQIIQSAQFSQSDEQSAADIIAQIEAGQDPTQNEEKAAAAGENLSSSITNAATIEVTHDQVLAATFFETKGLARDNLTPTQSQTLLNVLTNSAPVTVFDSRSFDEESLDGELNLSFPSDPNNDTLILTITELPKLGTLTLADGTPVTIGQVLSKSEFESLQFDAPEEYTLGDDAGQISYTVDDGQGADNSVQTGGVLVSINPINDIPEIIEVGSGQLVEAGSLDDGSAVSGVATASGKIEATDNDTDASLIFGVQDATSDYGTIAVDEITGEWVFTLDNDAPATQALKEGETIETSFTVTVTDDKGAQVTQTLPITIQGTNDAPTFGASGDTSGTVTEAGDGIGDDSVATGTLVATDVDADAALSYEVVDGSTDFGELTFDDDGKWTFTLDNESNATQALTEGEIKQLDFTVTVTDEFGATSSEVISISITGTNDSPVIVDPRGTTGTVSEAGVLDDGTLVPGEDNAAGIIRATDSDSDLTFSFEGDSGYGEFNVNPENGAWTFNLDNDSAVTQELREGEEVTVVYNVKAEDDNGSFIIQPVTITITGTNDQPQILSTSDLQGDVVEAGNLDDGTLVDGTPAASGTLIGSDVDANANLTFFIEDGASDYGSMNVTADGEWTFTLDNTSPQSQALKEGETHEQGFIVTIRDEFGAVSTDTITITITGTNDQPFITSESDLTGAVSESGHLDDGTIVAGIPTATGTLLGDDVDADAQLLFSIDDGVSDYGELEVLSNGDWTFTLDNESAHTQALEEGQTKDISYTVNVTDEFGAVNSEVVTITISGTNDVPVIDSMSDLSGAVTESGDNVPGAATVTGTVISTDVDADSIASFGFSGDSDYGDFVIDPISGDWTFTLDDTSDATQSLQDGATQDIVYTVSVTDDKGAITTEEVVITITGSNDLPVISGTSSGQVTEDNTDDIDDLTGDLTVGAKVDISDVDQD
ncbi:VCBS domain-containing protein, partial [Vibrio sp. 10N.261.51.F12]|uniref:VCBS domain-containing protein n=1 Tax=Vibrio sp. 10N.261.51.F12 TaxID=3229679 RepID=UPI00354F091D